MRYLVLSAYACKLINQVTEKTKFISFLGQEDVFIILVNAISILLINFDQCFMFSEVAYLFMSRHLSAAAETADIIVPLSPPSSRALRAAAVLPPGDVTSSFKTPG